MIMKQIIRVLTLLVCLTLLIRVSAAQEEAQSSSKQIVSFNHLSAVLAVEWNPDGNLLAVSSETAVSIWDVESQELVNVFDEDTQLVTSLSWNQDGQRLAALGTLTVVWDVSSSSNLEILKPPDDQSFGGVVEWSPDGSLLAFSRLFIDEDKNISGNEIQIWDENTEEISNIGNPLTSSLHTANWNKDGSLLAIADGDVISVWDFNTREIKVEIDEVSNVAAIAWSPISPLLAYGNSLSLGLDDEGTPRFQPTIEIWDMEVGEVSIQIETQIERIVAIAWSPDGELFATNDPDGNILIWELATGQVISTLQGHEAGVTSLAWRPDGTMLASGSRDGTARVWDVSNLINDS